MIQVQHVTKKYGHFTAVKDLSFEVEEGEIVALLGPNGAGKTTTMAIIDRLYAPNRGSRPHCRT